MRYVDRRLEAIEIHLDRDELIGCTVVRCMVKFGGKRAPIVEHSTMEECDVVFVDAAAITMEFVGGLMQIPEHRAALLAQLGLHPPIPGRDH